MMVDGGYRYRGKGYRVEKEIRWVVVDTRLNSLMTGLPPAAEDLPSAGITRLWPGFSERGR